MGNSASQDSNNRNFSWTDVLVSFLLILVGWFAIVTFSALFTRFVLDRISFGWALLLLALLISILYILISVASGRFALLFTSVKERPN